MTQQMIIQTHGLTKTYGQYAIGHAGGNIGTTSYMVYLPEHQVSIVVMINAFPNDASEDIVRGLTKVALKEVGAPEIVSFVEANWQFVSIGVIAGAFWVYQIPKETQKKRSQD